MREVRSVHPQVWVCPGVWQWREVWGTLRRLAGEEERRAGGGVQRWEAWDKLGRPSLAAQRGSACSGRKAQKHQRRFRPGDYMTKKKTKTPLDAHSALRPRNRTYPWGDKGGSPHSESTPRPKSDLKNKRLTPTILMTLHSLDELKLNARLHRYDGSPCFRRLLYEVQWHV